MLPQRCKWILVSGTIVIWTIKWLVRPLNITADAGDYWLGIAPNLLGSFLIPFGAYWLFYRTNNLIGKLFRMETNSQLRTVCSVSFFLLVVNEYLQRIPVFGRTFDYHDIMWSIPGLIIGGLAFQRLKLTVSINGSPARLNGQLL